MNTLPQQQSRGGCLGKGCVIFLGLSLLLVIAFAGGSYWAIHRLQKTYSTDSPTTFPELTTGWQQGTEDETETDEVVRAERNPPPQESYPSAAPVSVAEVQARWRAFEKAAERRQKARIELEARDINTLFENDPKLRGKAHVSIQENVGHVQVSIPMSDLLGGNAGGWAGTLFGVEGRYFNGAATVRPSPDGDPAKAEISNIRVGDKTVPDEFLDQRFFGFPSVRNLITDWLDDQQINRFDIRGNRVIAETRGR